MDYFIILYCKRGAHPLLKEEAGPRLKEEAGSRLKEGLPLVNNLYQFYYLHEQFLKHCVTHIINL